MKKFTKNTAQNNNSFEWGVGKEADSIRTMTSRDLSVSFHGLLKGQNLKNGIWIFGYGSLMWNPDFKFSEKITGVVSGYHRRLCLKSTVYRGTPDFPGLVFGLDKGGECHGVAFHIPAEHYESELQIVWEREMFAETYIPTWVSIQTKQRCISAITFVINSNHEHYVPNLELEEVAKRVIRAEGKCGSCHDYVRNTVKCLQQQGLRDSILDQLLTIIENHTSYEYSK